MKIINRYLIKSEGDLLFCRMEIRNFLKKHKKEYVENFVFAIMELGSNILKYAKEGEIWLLGIENEYILAALDRGEGIEDINWALKEGNSSSKTLGIGLSSLNKIEGFEISILSLSNSDFKGTAVIFRPKVSFDYLYMMRNYLDLPHGGDFFYKKGKFFIIGDVNGHGKKAERSAKKIIEFFKKRAISCIVIDELFNKLNEFIKKNDLRGVVLSVIEKTKYISICGVGNIKIFVKHLNDIEFFSQKEGIIGECFSGSSKFVFELDKNSIGVFTDGIEEALVREVFLKSDDVLLNVVAVMYFSKIRDDKTMLIFKEEK
ncbi:hypothetical protein [Caminibacter sp.]